MATQYHVNPRFRAYGKARLDIARRADSREAWLDLWKPAQHTFPFRWGKYWKQCVEYRVQDFAAEVGFFIDVLGFVVNSLDTHYAQFTSPEGEFYIAVLPNLDGAPTPHIDGIRLQFMIRDLHKTVQELETRGVAFEALPQPIQPGSRLEVASFRTPNGMLVELWGYSTPGLQFRQVTVSSKPWLRRSPMPMYYFDGGLD
jgi:catechol 2,3-dioxygenase-like lactoylglutathione lyase family enzyme